MTQLHTHYTNLEFEKPAGEQHAPPPSWRIHARGGSGKKVKFEGSCALPQIAFSRNSRLGVTPDKHRLRAYLRNLMLDVLPDENSGSEHHGKDHLWPVASCAGLGRFWFFGGQLGQKLKSDIATANLCRAFHQSGPAWGGDATR